MTTAEENKPGGTAETSIDGGFRFLIRWVGFSILYYAGVFLLSGPIVLIFYGHGSSEAMSRFADVWMPAAIDVLAFGDHSLWASIVWGLWIALIFRAKRKRRMNRRTKLSKL
jgi:hypothetical protein